jgi:glyoxylase-like metal-dependent hydrolase (beta-lactamase superfamily II)
MPMTNLAKIIFRFRNFLDRLNKQEKSDSSINRCEFDIIIEEDFDLNPFGVDGKVLHTPGHSKGSVSIIVGTKAIIGDNLMAMLPWSKPSRPIVAYDMAEIKNSMIRLIEMKVKSFYLSHGSHYDIHEIKKAIETLK